MNDIKSALNALVNRRQEVDFPAFKGVFVRPLPLNINLGFLASAEGETEADRDHDYNTLVLSFCLVDSESNTIFTKEEFNEWYEKADWDIINPLQKAISSLNDFNAKSPEAKKK